MRRRLAKGGCIRAQPIAQGRTLHVQPHRRPEIALGGTGPLFGIFTRLTYPVAYESIALTDVDVHMIGAGHGSFGPAALAHCIFRLEMRDDNLIAIQHAVGAGADGIVVPHVHAADVCGALSTSFRERR